MSYSIITTPAAEKDIKKLRETGNIAALKKLNALLDELREHPQTGTGKPEKLRHQLSGCWSRRISQENRLVYIINEEQRIVFVVRAHSHYVNNSS